MIIAARIIKTLVDKTMTSLRSKEIGRGGLMECHVNKNFDFVQVYNRHKNVENSFKTVRNVALC
jgi:hypothetical protein